MEWGCFEAGKDCLISFHRNGEILVFMWMNMVYWNEKDW